MRFIEKFEENVRNYPDKVILRDSETSLTFRELDELSGRVYAYLKQKGIGKEDFTMIQLPHGLDAYICLLGVWRAGAATVVVDAMTGIERVAFIHDDCKCTFTISQQIWNEILHVNPCKGHTKTDPHDAAFAVYTSGSEGTPKGVIHEYGSLDFMPLNLKRLVEKVCDKPLSTESIQYSYVPISTIGTIAICTMSIWHPLTSDIGSLDLMKNPQKLREYIETRNDFSIAFFPPSYYIYNKIAALNIGLVYLASEPLNDYYQEDNCLLNIYIQSEGYHICGFRLDKAYKNTPIGNPTDKEMVMLFDDDEQITKKGAIGELCYRNPYFRGYINDEERTRNSFVNGYFRSGDIARVNEDGNYVILGRKTDMIKINGNRIEPAEIEAAVKRVLGIDWAFAKGFVQPERSFICVYYTAEVDIDYAKTREELLKILPAYMIPSYFIKVDCIPRLPNGKVNRQAFKAPAVEEYITEYTAPANELEERLCQTMQEVLGLERIGTHDDFYLLGGDSLRTIQLVSQLNIDELTVTDVYAARTPKAIAERWFGKQLLCDD